MELNKILKPCPFCGSEARVGSLEMDRTGVRRITVDCGCGVNFEVESDDLIYSNGVPYQVGETAIDKWNKRSRDEVEPGEWVDEKGNPTKAEHSVYCNSCNNWSEYRTEFCPHCGIPMKETNYASDE